MDLDKLDSYVKKEADWYLKQIFSNQICKSGLVLWDLFFDFFERWLSSYSVLYGIAHAFVEKMKRNLN